MSFAKFIFYLILLGGISVGVIYHYNGKYRESYIAQIMDKASNYDDAGIAAEVDWEKLRAFMIDDLISRAAKTNPVTGDSSRGYNLSPEHIRKAVNYYVQPQNIVLLFRLKKGYAPYYYESDFIGSIKPYHLTGIEVVFKHPDRKSLNPLFANSQVRAIFTLNRDIKWKLTELHVPLNMIPTSIPSQAK